jgi:hypothetical protein
MTVLINLQQTFSCKIKLAFILCTTNVVDPDLQGSGTRGFGSLSGNYLKTLETLSMKLAI